MTITAKDLWDFSESLNTPMTRLADTKGALGAAMSDLDDDAVAHTACVVALAQQAVTDAYAELLALQEKILEKGGERRAVPIVGSMGHDQDKVAMHPEVLERIVAEKKANATASGWDLMRVYRLVCSLGDHEQELEDVRRTLVGLSMTSGIEDHIAETLNLCLNEMERSLSAIESLTEPVVEAYREANGINHKPQPEAAQ